MKTILIMIKVAESGCDYLDEHGRDADGVVRFPDPYLSSSGNLIMTTIMMFAALNGLISITSQY